MDGVLTSKDLIRHYFESANELLLSHSTASGFFYGLIHLLDEELQFTPVLLHLPLLQYRHVYATDRRLLELLRQDGFPEGDQPSEAGPWLFLPLPELGAKHGVVVHRDLRSHAIFNTFMDMLPFYIRQIDRLDRFSSRLTLLRCQTLVKKAFEDELSLEEILQCLGSSLRNEHLFLYCIRAGGFIAPKTTLEAVKTAGESLMNAIHQTLSRGDYLKEPEYHESIKSLILYPVLLSADCDILIGSFSSENRIQSDLDFELICDFALDTHNMRRLMHRLALD